MDKTVEASSNIVGPRTPAWREFHRTTEWSREDLRLRMESAHQGKESSDFRFPRKVYSRFPRLNLGGRSQERPLRAASVRAFDRRAIHIDSLMSVFEALLIGDAGVEQRMLYPSAGGLYSLEWYAVAQHVTGMRHGLYHLLPEQRAFEYLWPEDRDQMLGAFQGQEWALSAPLLLVVTASMRPYQHRYGERGYRFALLEAGHAIQEVLTSSQRVELSTCVVGGFSDADLSAVLGLRETDDEVPISAVAIGAA